MDQENRPLYAPYSGYSVQHLARFGYTGTIPYPIRTCLNRLDTSQGDVAFWPSLTGEEILRALESLRVQPSNRQRERELIEAFDLDVSKKARKYSTGNRRKVSLSAALSIDARTLILDEPTAGLDPLMEQVFVEEVRKATSEGASILLSSHILSEVEKLCATVTVIKAGRVVTQGALSRLRHLSAYEVSGYVKDITKQDLFPTAEISGNTITLTVDRNHVNSTLQTFIDAGEEGITSQPASLETIFLKHFSRAQERIHVTNDGDSA